MFNCITQVRQRREIRSCCITWRWKTLVKKSFIISEKGWVWAFFLFLFFLFHGCFCCISGFDQINKCIYDEISV